MIVPAFRQLVSNTLHELTDRLRQGPRLLLRDEDRLDGRTALVTGASQGIGLSISTELAQRGAHVIMACRSGLESALDSVRRRASENAGTIEGLSLDLSDLHRVAALVDELAEDGARLDVTVLSTSVLSDVERGGSHDLEEVFQVHRLANFLLVRRLLERGVISASNEGEDPDDLPKEVFAPRVVMVSSDARTTIETLAAEFSRRAPGVSFHTSDPHPVAAELLRDARPWMKPAIDSALRRWRTDPSEAASSLVWLAASREIEGRRCLYLRGNARAERNGRAGDPAAGPALWQSSEALLRVRGIE